MLPDTLYTTSLTQFIRRKTNTVKIGDLYMGSDYPIRIQSMTTTDTMDTAQSVAQIIRMVNAGCELVRLTAPSINEAANLENIKRELKKQGIYVPLVADIHFTPNAAEMAARLVEKVRINPGNYADKKKFQTLEYNDAEYAAEIERIREKFIPLIKICKEYGTALRIGTNHGSLSDRILSRYGDTPEGMVESAMEFLRIAEDENFHNIVLSMKASNPQVMIQAYRMLVHTMNKNGMHYPLHLGVTEAGDGDDGRIKSALGIGSLLEDGIGDTIRVSLTEDPEFEIPVARRLAARYSQREKNPPIPETSEWWNKHPEGFYSYRKRITEAVGNIGGTQVPRIIAGFEKGISSQADLAPVGYFYDAVTDKWNMGDLGADYIYLGSNPSPFMLPMGLHAIYDAATWSVLPRKEFAYPLISAEAFMKTGTLSGSMNFIACNTEQIKDAAFTDKIKKEENCVLLLSALHPHTLSDLRNAFGWLESREVKTPVILNLNYRIQPSEESLDLNMLYASADAGALLSDGLSDGIFFTENAESKERLNQIGFGILQAARARISKTEYISCPSCGRTLFDLQETTAMIRKRTDHLKGVKIAIMGCIVNGPGEMADADFGYVGSGPGKITLYRGKEIVKRSIPSEHAVDDLITLIREHGMWVDPV